MIDVKCKSCNKLLAKADSMNAAIKCPRCKMIFEYKIHSNLFVTNLYDKNYTNTSNTDRINVESSETVLDNRATTSVKSE